MDAWQHLYKLDHLQSLYKASLMIVESPRHKSEMDASINVIRPSPLIAS